RLESSAAAERITGTDEPNADVHRFFTLDVSGKDSMHSLKPRPGKSRFALNTRRVFATTCTAGFAANREERLPIPTGDRTAWGPATTRRCRGARQFVGA